MARRDEEKKRRQLKRRLKRKQTQQSFDHSSAPPELKECFKLLSSLKNLLKVPGPSEWPGAVDPALARPDHVKLEFATWATETDLGRSKREVLEHGFCNGPLGFLPEMDHWALEEFLWHGVPGDHWQPIDAYLASAGNRYSPAAREQLRLWKQAKLSFYEVGEVSDDLVSLREWEPFSGNASGPWLRAISLGIGGVNFYRENRGKLSLTYVSPWSKAPDILCAMGYGYTVPKAEIEPMLPLLGILHPAIVARPLPWQQNKHAEAVHLRTWQAREWYGWLQERIVLPFRALVLEPHGKGRKLRMVNRLLPSTAREAREFGIYFEVPMEGDAAAIGATGVAPLDVTSPNLLALREYSAYREHAGAPPGVRGRPQFFRV